MDPNVAVKNIIAAHGGEDFWNGLKALEAEISVSGRLFTFKRRPVLDHVRVPGAIAMLFAISKI